MTASLDGIRALHAGITPGDYDSVLSANRKWALVLRSPGTEDETLVAKCVDDDDAAFFAAAPSIVAQLLAVVDRVEKIAADLDDLAELRSGSPGTRSNVANRLRAALTGEGGV